ncbi:MAG TPA: hypothetical protein VFC63_24020 [Blastocatellia bacterium]|nr:hypothetical protein [Blastocatellia bacterium]
MAIKVENKSSIPTRGDIVLLMQSMLELVPVEHLRGLTKVVILDNVESQFVDATQRAQLPFLYIPKTPGSSAWGQVALSPLLPRDSFMKKISGKLSFKANLAQTVYALVGQHYALTLGKNRKKGQLEAAVRTYVEKYFKEWRESHHKIRTKIFKPIQPYLEKFAKKLQKKYAKSLKEQN